MKVFLDVDGLLADFVVGACIKLNKQVPNPWPKNCYRLEQALGVTVGELWDAIDSVSFWSNLPQTLYAQDVLGVVSRFLGPEKMKTDFSLLTALPSVVDDTWMHDVSAAAGKVLWLNKNFPGLPYHLTTDKSQIATPLGLLIDDSDTEVRRWRSNGGEAILFPRPWNNLAHVRDSVAWVETQIERYK